MEDDGSPRPLSATTEQGRATFLNALDSFRSAVEGLDDRQLLGASRCFAWSRLDALGHVHLGLQEMLRGFVAGAAGPATVDAAGYWRTSPPKTDDAADEVDGLSYLRRWMSAYRRPRGGVRHFGATAAAVRTAAERLDAPAVEFQGQVLSAGDFLVTWAVELAVHHLDLDLADQTDADPDPGALHWARRTLEALVGGPLPATWTDTQAVLLGWGRLAITDELRTEAGATGVRLPIEP